MDTAKTWPCCNFLVASHDTSAMCILFVLKRISVRRYSRMELSRPLQAFVQLRGIPENQDIDYV